MILRQFESFLGSRCFPLALDSKGRQQDPGKALAKIPWERLSPACGEHGTRWGRESCGGRLLQELLPRLQAMDTAHLGKTGISQNPSPARPDRVQERSAPTPKSLTTPRGCPLGTPWDPCPALHQHPAKIPAGSTRFCLPARGGCPGTSTRPHLPKTSSAPPILSQTFTSNPRSSCWERLSCPLEQPRVGDAQSHPQWVEDPSGGQGGDTGGDHPVPPHAPNCSARADSSREQGMSRGLGSLCWWGHGGGL